ncbi:MAG TPA: aspartate kinase [Cyanobacteria bacterium UBA8156]|jgi:aspartate kinase|nr:aspartate kinase [Cyanobacteria bacterium UBA8156]
MAILVQKFGGSSVATPDRLHNVRDRILQTVAAGHPVVAVVSAMGKTTDELLALAAAVTEGRGGSDRERDLLLASGEQVSVALLALALQAAGQPAVGLLGHHLRIVAEPIHGRARILYVETDRLWAHLHQGEVVVVAGFQGVAAMGDRVTDEIVTLGRGGSDTSAVAIAAALAADRCEIYTDVPGILTTDPRIVPAASLLTTITCDEMLELASQGAKVLHPRAVEIARNFGVDLVVRSSWSQDPGTLVVSPPHCQGNPKALEVHNFVEGVTLDDRHIKVGLLEVPDRPGIAAQLFGALAEAGIEVETIIQSIYDRTLAGPVNDIVFTVPRSQQAAAAALLPTLPFVPQSIQIDPEVVRVSIVGVGIVGRPGIVAQMFDALAQAQINIQTIATSEIEVSCLVARAEGDRAAQLLQDTFGVPQVPVLETTLHPEARVVCGVALDRQRVKLAVRGVPDRPGAAAQIFRYLADRGIVLDTIAQAQSSQNTNDIVFTVATADASSAQAALETVAQALGCRDVIYDGEIAKVSIVGAAMARQAGVAARMFRALADLGVNIETIATSEIKVSCIVREQQAEAAVHRIHEAFALGGDRPVVVPNRAG